MSSWQELFFFPRSFAVPFLEYFPCPPSPGRFLLIPQHSAEMSLSERSSLTTPSKLGVFTHQPSIPLYASSSFSLHIHLCMYVCVYSSFYPTWLSRGRDCFTLSIIISPEPSTWSLLCPQQMFLEEIKATHSMYTNCQEKSLSSILASIFHDMVNAVHQPPLYWGQIHCFIWPRSIFTCVCGLNEGELQPASLAVRPEPLHTPHIQGPLFLTCGINLWGTEGNLQLVLMQKSCEQRTRDR